MDADEDRLVEFAAIMLPTSPRFQPLSPRERQTVYPLAACDLPVEDVAVLIGVPQKSVVRLLRHVRSVLEATEGRCRATMP